MKSGSSHIIQREFMKGRLNVFWCGCFISHVHVIYAIAICNAMMCETRKGNTISRMNCFCNTHLISTKVTPALKLRATAEHGLMVINSDNTCLTKQGNGHIFDFFQYHLHQKVDNQEWLNQQHLSFPPQKVFIRYMRRCWAIRPYLVFLCELHVQDRI